VSATLPLAITESLLSTASRRFLDSNAVFVNDHRIFAFSLIELYDIPDRVTSVILENKPCTAGSLLSSVRDFQAIRSRVRHTLEKGVQIDLTTEPCKRYLRRHVNKKVGVVILYADIDGSTKMSMTLQPDVFATIIHIFSQEMTLAISESGGYTLKYVGDAVIGLFPAEYDKNQASKNAVECAKFMQEIVAQGINPELKSHGYPELSVKVSVEFGEVQVVLYGKSLERSHIDIVGSSISAAAKMIAVAQGGQIVIGKSIYDNIIALSSAEGFARIDADTSRWSNADDKAGYGLYLLK
jgi:adenylate cyclase